MLRQPFFPSPSPSSSSCRPRRIKRRRFRVARSQNDERKERSAYLRLGREDEDEDAHARNEECARIGKNDFNWESNWQKDTAPFSRDDEKKNEKKNRAALLFRRFAFCALFVLMQFRAPLPAQSAGIPRERMQEQQQTFSFRRGGQRNNDKTVRKKSRAKRNSFVRKAAESVGPCVVRVDAMMPSPSSIAGGSSNDNGNRQRKEEEGPSSSSKNKSVDEWHAGGGCGLVLDSTLGRVVTNAHVVGNSQKVRVTFTDGRTYIADVKGVDQTADIALLKLNLRASHVLPRCDIGDSDEVEVGDWAVAVGNPFGLDNSVALGIISNLARTSTELGIPERRSLEFFQTDTAINPGNSGGPLVNEFSEVIAINAAIRQDADGIGFAIPINTVRRVAEALSRGEIIARPYLGIEMATLLEGKSTSSPSSSSGDNNANVNDVATKNPPREGALIVKVSDASPARIAGLRAGDVIIDCNGEAIVDANQVRKIVREADPGKVLSIVVWRVDTFALETLDVVVGDASLGRVSTNINNNNNRGMKNLDIAPPGMGGVRRRA
jgi:S1-C subfamily serine protease